jgi:hypothetical protein
VVQALMLRGEAELGEPWGKQLALGLGLVFLGKQGAIEATLEARCLSLPATMLNTVVHAPENSPLGR